MSRAVQCDACGNLTAYLNSVQLSVGLPKTDDLSDDWGEVDICARCLQRPLSDVLDEACDGFADANKRRGEGAP